jgi:hypothetical protein
MHDQDENESGLFDFEQQRYEEEQDLLTMDPHYLAWVAMMDAIAQHDYFEKNPHQDRKLSP